MQRQRRTTIIVVGGALAIASVGYGLGSQAGDGTAVADNNTTEQDGSGVGRGGAPPLPFDRGAPPGLSRLADKLGVDSTELMTALRDYHDQHASDRRDEFAAKLAKALGISSDTVKGAFESLHARHEGRFAARLATALGVDADKVKAALDELEGDRPASPGEFAQKLADELGLETSKVESALARIRPFVPGPRGAPGPDGSPGHPGPGRGHHDRALPLRQLAKALGVSRADLRDAFRQLRAGAENDWKQERRALARFLADRFDLDLAKVEDALAATAPPLRSPDRSGPPDHPTAL
ncbi:MAG TPA: Clp protease N-terminal domain-containing protein [Thermoleophilaceae bacterium]|nr:Clp protease N-terminal domain-containing protein [Thermoleophilaceae bacterium]